MKNNVTKSNSTLARKKLVADMIARRTAEESGNYIFKPEDHPTWNAYSKKTKDYIKKTTDEYTYKYIIPKIEESSGMTEAEILNNYKEQAKIRFKTQNPTEDNIKTLIKEDAIQHVEQTRKGYKMEWETASKEYNKDYDVDNYTESQSVEIKPDKEPGAKKTPLEITREENQVTRDVLIPEVRVDEAGGEYIVFVRKQGHYDLANEIVGETTYGSVPVEKLESTPTYITMDKVYIKSNVGKPFITPMDYVRNNQTGMFEPIISTGTKLSIREALRKQNQYIFGGVKDKGIFKVRELHLDTDLYTKDQLVLKMANGNRDSLKKAQQSYNEGLALELEWLGLKSPKDSLGKVNTKDPAIANAIKQYNSQWKSNVLIEAERQGYYEIGSNDVSNIHNLLSKGHSKNIIDWTKRQQLYNDKTLALKANAKDADGNNIFKSYTFKFDVFEDINQFGEYHRIGKDGKTETAFYESWTDGIVLLKPEIYDAIEASVNLPKSSMFKPVMTVKMPDGGVMVVKSAGQRLSEKKDYSALDFMNQRELDMMIFTSAAKHTGNTKPLKLEIDSKGIYSAETRPEGKGITMPIDNVRINLGTYIDPKKAVKPQVIATQLSSNINNAQSKGGAKAFYEEILSKGHQGTKDSLIDEYRSTGDASKLKNVNIDDLSIKKIHEVFTRDADWANRTENDIKLAKILSRKIAKMDKNGELEDLTSFNKDEWKQYIYRNNRILDNTDFDSVFRHIFPSSSKYFNDIYKKFPDFGYHRLKVQYLMKNKD